MANSGTSLGNKTFQGQPNLHPETQRRLDDLVKSIGATTNGLDVLEKSRITSEQATAIATQVVKGALALPVTIGFSGTITTAKLTGGGANGSMTFVNGVLTKQTPAT